MSAAAAAAAAADRPEEDFATALERLVVEQTNETLRRIAILATRHGVEAKTVERAIDRYSGADLADCWFEFAAEDPT